MSGDYAVGRAVVVRGITGPYRVSTQQIEQAKRAYLEWVYTNRGKLWCRNCGTPRQSIGDTLEAGCVTCGATPGFLTPIDTLARWVNGNPVCFMDVDDIVDVWSHSICNGYSEPLWRVLRHKIRTLPESVRTALGFE
jgi:hypothetical protein